MSKVTEWLNEFLLKVIYWEIPKLKISKFSAFHFNFEIQDNQNRLFTTSF